MAFALVGDVGGTNARMALCNLESGEISSVKTYPTSYPSLEEVIRQYLKDTGAEVKNSCIAMACPIKGDEVVMTNASWSFSIKETKELTKENEEALKSALEEFVKKFTAAL